MGRRRGDRAGRGHLPGRAQRSSAEAVEGLAERHRRRPVPVARRRRRLTAVGVSGGAHPGRARRRAEDLHGALRRARGGRRTPAGLRRDHPGPRFAAAHRRGLGRRLHPARTVPLPGRDPGTGGRRRDRPDHGRALGGCAGRGCREPAGGERPAGRLAGSARRPAGGGRGRCGPGRCGDGGAGSAVARLRHSSARARSGRERDPARGSGLGAGGRPAGPGAGRRAQR